jgi:hypothetical protein
MKNVALASSEVLRRTPFLCQLHAMRHHCIILRRCTGAAAAYCDRCTLFSINRNRGASAIVMHNVDIRTPSGTRSRLVRRRITWTWDGECICGRRSWIGRLASGREGDTWIA